jgi:hypothetical protein
LILCGFRAFAIPNNLDIEQNPLNMPGFAIEITIEGGFFGYSVSVMNTGPEQVKGNLTLNISTDAMFVLFGETLSKDIELDLNPINGVENFKLQPILGFGSASISISGLFRHCQIEYPINNETSGYAFLFFILCDETIINIP